MSAYLELGMALCLGIFSLALVVGSVAANFATGVLIRFRLGTHLTTSPSLLFLLRVFPLGFGSFVALGLALPSFLLLEPHQTRESPEFYLLVLAILSVIVLATVGVRLLRVLWTTTLMLRKWEQTGERIDLATPVPVFRVEAPASLFAVIGIFKPRVFIGREAFACLSSDELDAAIAHEAAHVQSLDNLKRLVLSITRLPRYLSHLDSIDAAWSEAVEFAADEKALQGSASVLELGSAIVKIGRLHGKAMPLMAACQLVMSDAPSAMAIRLERLRFMLENPVSSAEKPQASFTRILFASLMLGYLLALPSALELAHKAMEWLVR